ncbi:hypothetical protein Tco_1420861 [Tanacetum coccineum]
MFLSNPAKSEGFEQIVDFLNTNHIRYALTINPTIYTSCIEQFWATIKVKIVNGEVQLQALVDGKKIIITEASVRRDLQLKDKEGTDCLPNATIFEERTRMGYEKLSQKLIFYKAFFSPQWKFLIHTILQCLSAKTTVWNEFSSTMASAIICLATNQKFNFSKYIFKSMVKNLDNVDNVVDEAVNEEMDDSLVRASTTASSLDAEQDRGNINKTQSKVTLNEPSFLGTSSGSGPRRQDSMGDTIARTSPFPGEYKDCLSSKDYKFETESQEVREERRVRNSQAQKIIQEITLVHETQGRFGDEEMFDTGVLDGDEVLEKPEATVKDVNLSIDEVTLAQALAALKSAKQATTPIVSFQQPSHVKAHDKGKGIMVEIPVKMKKKDQISLDEELTFKLQAEEEEEERLVREKAQQLKEANIIAWDNVQAMIDADYQMAQQMQEKEQEKLSIKEKSKLFVQLLEARKKHFVTMRAP